MFKRLFLFGLVVGTLAILLICAILNGWWKDAQRTGLFVVSSLTLAWYIWGCRLRWGIYGRVCIVSDYQRL